MLHELLDGAEGPIRDIVLLNAAAALIVAGKAKRSERRRRDRRQIDRLRAPRRRSLAKLVAITNAPDADA